MQAESFTISGPVEISAIYASSSKTGQMVGEAAWAVLDPNHNYSAEQALALVKAKHAVQGLSGLAVEHVNNEHEHKTPQATQNAQQQGSQGRH